MLRKLSVPWRSGPFKSILPYNIEQSVSSSGAPSQCHGGTDRFKHVNHAVENIGDKVALDQLLPPSEGSFLHEIPDRLRGNVSIVDSAPHVATLETRPMAEAWFRTREPPFTAT